MKFFNLLPIYIGLCVLSACGSSSGDEPTPVPTPSVAKKEVKLNVGINTRATDSAFENGDKVGLFMVNYTNNAAGTLQNSGNYAHNVSYTYSSTGAWNTESPIYWKDDNTNADFYVYYPYGTPSSVESHAFNIATDQSTEANYKASIFLHGTNKNVAPTSNAVSLNLSHTMSCAIVKVEPGDGFTTEKLNAANISVTLNNTKTQSTVNLKTGVATATGNAQKINMFKSSATEFKAIVVPQEVSQTSLFTVTVDGKEYNLSKGFSFVGGTRYTFTIKVSKTSSGINIGITGWTDDGKDYGGTAS